MKWILNLALASGLLTPARGQPIDARRSSITIHVGKAGLFAAAAHEHWVDAPIASGAIEPQGIHFTVDTAKLSVREEKDWAEVQQNMQTKVLESSTYPEIAFQSTRAERRNDAWTVTGDLKLHGMVKSITVTTRQENGAYSGTTRIKQTDFGIQPIRIGGGVIKVKDELEISFRIFAASGP